jgi:hypothetical protein
VSAGELEQQLQASQKRIEALEAEQQRLGGVNLKTSSCTRRLKVSETSFKRANRCLTQLPVSIRRLRIVIYN